MQVNIFIKEPVAGDQVVGVVRPVLPLQMNGG